MNPRSILITSGTLTPFSEMESDLNLHFPVKLVNDHVIEWSQIFMSVLKGGESGHYMNLSHMNMAKNSDKIVEDVGRSVANIVKENKQGGVLVFFQSYDKMFKLLREWHTLNLLNEQYLGKKLFFEDSEPLFTPNNPQVE